MIIIDTNVVRIKVFWFFFSKKNRLLPFAKSPAHPLG